MDAVCEFVKHGYHHLELSSEHADVLIKRDATKLVGAKFKEFCDTVGIESAVLHYESMDYKNDLSEECKKECNAAVLKRLTELHKGYSPDNLS